MKEITLEECKRIQLEMLVEIDTFCRISNIRYMLAFGTLLGAVRHKGFIPWDDDVDISMPLEDMLRFKKEFKSEKLKYCDVYTEENYEFGFSRICYKPTYSKDGIINKTYGIHIDLYPLIEVTTSEEKIKEIINRGLPLLRKKRMLIKWRKRIVRILPIKTIPFFKKSILDYQSFLFKELYQKGGGRYHCIAGPLLQFEVHTFDFNPFEEMIELEFEGLKFMGPKKFHDYLTKRYGNYMQLPPVDQRHPYHCGKYYWK